MPTLTRAARFWRLPYATRLLALRAFGVVAAIRLALWIVPFQKLLGLAGDPAPGRASHSIEDLVWAVRSAARMVPMATCLTQSLALQWLLRRSGYPAAVRLGVTLHGGFKAHAWVDCGGKTILGAEPDANYTPLPAFEA
jgi:hypothetical protein